MSRNQFQKFKLLYPDHSEKLDNIVGYAGPKAIIKMDRVEGPPVQLTDTLWKLALNIDRRKFSSYFVQLKEILALPKSRVRSILEVGPGLGVLQALLKLFPYQLTTVDINAEHEPDIVCDILQSPIKTKTFDLITCFQVLEHIPYRYFAEAIKTLASIANNYIFISVPHQRNTVSVRIMLRLVNRYISRLNSTFDFLLPIYLPLRDIDDTLFLEREDKQNPHYWEAGRRSFRVRKIVQDIEATGLTILKRFHNPDFPYHYFILCEID